MIKNALMFSVLLFAATPAYSSQAQRNNTWYSISDSDTVFIFVHGIFSDSGKCWSASNGSYWPEILKEDPRFNNPNIYLGGYYTDFSSGIYKISDAADELLTHLRSKDVKNNPAPLTKPNIIFIAHSTGGLVVRYLIERNQGLLKDKTIGLMLLASPSDGSAWANRLKWLIDLYKNKMAAQLERDNGFVGDLNSRFSDLVGHKKLSRLIGVDVFENKFIIPGILWNSEQLVSEMDSKSYFGAGRIVPNSDHFSVAKPESASDYSHVLLWDFYENTFRPVAGELNAKAVSAILKTSYNELTNVQLQNAVFRLIPKMRIYLEQKESIQNSRSQYYRQLMNDAKSREEKDRIWNMETSESLSSPSLNSEYSTHFKSEAILLNEEMVKRLPIKTESPEQLNMRRFRADYDHPTNPIGLNGVIDDLEMLAKQLPK